MLEGGAGDTHNVGAVFCLVIGEVSLYSIGAVSLYSIGVVSLYSKRRAFWAGPAGPGQAMAMDGPWPWTVHRHGQSMAMDCPWPWDSPWPWTVHGHEPSMAMDRPWPWTVHGHGPACPSPAQKARRCLLYTSPSPRDS